MKTIDIDIPALTLLVAVLKTVNLVADFMLEVVGEKVRCYDPQLRALWRPAGGGEGGVREG